MGKERELLPIGDGLDVYEGAEAESRRVRIDLQHLPEFLDANSLVVDIQRLFTLMRVAGIGFLNVVTTDDRSGDGSVPMVVGVDANGQAVGGHGKRVTDKPDFDVNETGETVIGGKNAKEIGITVRLNFDDIVAMIGAKNERINSVEAWSKVMDDNLKHALKIAGLNHLMDINKSDLIAFLLLFSLIYFQGMPIDIFSVSWTVFVSSPMFRLLEKFLLKKDKGKTRLSVCNISGIEIDRAIILFLMLRSRQLIHSVVPDSVE
ncbi:MAG: hypothetical protein WC873_04115 [Candidatus Gracilibacteria bacterium]